MKSKEIQRNIYKKIPIAISTIAISIKKNKTSKINLKVYYKNNYFDYFLFCIYSANAI
jgi:hypothetical protein